MEIKNTYDELDVQEEYKHTEELSENINPLEENNGSDIPSVVFTKKITSRKQYNKLKDFLKEKGFILIWDEIDCGYDYYEFAFEKNQLFSSTIDVLEYFRNNKFNVEFVHYRNYTSKDGCHPSFKLKKFIKDGKDIFEVRVLCNSEFFDEYFFEDDDIENVEEFKSSIEDKCEVIKKPFKLKKSVVFFIPVITLLVMVSIYLLSIPITDLHVSVENIKTDTPSARTTIEEISLDSEFIEDKHNHLIFNTKNGIKEFHNAEYTNYPFKTVIESYYGNSVYRKDIFSRWSINEITQIKETSWKGDENK